MKANKGFLLNKEYFNKLKKLSFIMECLFWFTSINLNSDKKDAEKCD